MKKYKLSQVVSQQLEEGLNNMINIHKSKRIQYLQQCKEENNSIRQSYGPILITYIRKPQKLVLPPIKMNQDQLIRYYAERFQNTPVGCVVAINIEGNIHYGWSFCRTDKDRFNKVISLNRALNRACNNSLPLSYMLSKDAEEVPTVVKSYLKNLKIRAAKYFKFPCEG